MHKIEQLTFEESEFHSGHSGHISSLEEVMLVIDTFLALYICSWAFLVFLLLFAGLSITSMKWWKEKVDSGKHRPLFYSTTVVVVILSVSDAVISLALFGVDVTLISKNEPVGFLKDTTKKFAHQNKSYLYTFLTFRTFTPYIFILLFISITFCYKLYFKGKKAKHFFPDNKSKAFSAFFFIYYIFMTLFQIVPVMCHMVMYPVHTLSFMVQYLCSLFILLLFAYQLTMCFDQLVHFLWVRFGKKGACPICSGKCSSSFRESSTPPPIDVRVTNQHQQEQVEQQENGQQQEQLEQQENRQDPPLESQAQRSSSETQAQRSSSETQTQRSSSETRAQRLSSETQAQRSSSETQAQKPPSEGQGLQTDEELPTHDAQKCCMYMIKACTSLFGLALILLTGFLYFAVTFMGVNVVTLTMFVITIMIGIMSTVIGGKLNKCLEKEGKAN